MGSTDTEILSLLWLWQQRRLHKPQPLSRYPPIPLCAAIGGETLRLVSFYNVIYPLSLSSSLLQTVTSFSPSHSHSLSLFLHPPFCTIFDLQHNEIKESWRPSSRVLLDQMGLWHLVWFLRELLWQLNEVWRHYRQGNCELGCNCLL